MSLSRWMRAGLVAGLVTAVAVVATPEAWSQKDAKKQDTKKKADKPKPSTTTAEEVLKPAPRPKKDPLPASKTPFEVVKGERIAFVGNSTGERMNLFGHFETALHTKFPDKELVVRNFCRPADEVSVRQRSSDYFKLDDPLYAFNPDTLICFFGYNESFAGPDGLEKFKADYDKFLEDFTRKYPRDDAGSPPRFVIVTPIAFENTGDKHLPDGKAVNANLKLYAAACGEVAAKHKIAFADIYDPTAEIFGKSVGFNFTINGAHVNEAGDREVSLALFRRLFGNPPNIVGSSSDRLRAAINDKSWVHSQDYRMLNGWYVYGGRRTYDTETFPLEYRKIRNMAAVRDRFVWDIAQGKQVASNPDDGKTGELFTPSTRFGQGNKSEGPELRYMPPDELIKSCTIPEGFEIKLFADEKQFPEIAKPVQMTFDNKGRLWVSTMPSYPQWKPGDPKPSDKIVILEDTDGDGKADKCTVFYDKLHCPTGFEFYKGGVLVVNQPRLIFLKDIDGDDKADEVVELLDGWASDDTHHTIGAFEWSHGGYLNMLEGVSMSTAVETPQGAFRNFGSSGNYILDPRTLKLRHYVTPGYGNPWCYVYNDWGQGFCGDGTGANQHWDTLLSGEQFQGRRGVPATIAPEGMRPVVGSEFLRTRQFPDEWQEKFIYACVINMNGLTTFSFREDGSGYLGTRDKKDTGMTKKNKDGKVEKIYEPVDILSSTHKHFRPVDPQVGPDGAIWFGDWANALIGHMQYSQRDPNRNHDLGRIYRLVYTKKPLLKPVTQFGKSTPEVLDQLKEYENRTRYRARRELWARPEGEVKAAVKAWVAKLDRNDPNYDKLTCEALWVLQGHRAVDPDLLNEVLKAKTPNARAAAVKIAADERASLPNALDILKRTALDESPRVRIEAVRGLSFFNTPDAADAVIASAKLPLDQWSSYVVQSTLGATETAWAGRYLAKQVGQDDKKLGAMMEDLVKSSKAGAAAAPYLAILIGAGDRSKEERNKAMQALVNMKGNVDKGKQVFRNASCTACHKIFAEGQDYGPNQNDVGSRLTKLKIIESIIDPNADVDAKYTTTRIVTTGGKQVQGLLVSEDKDAVVIFDGKEKKTIPLKEIDERTQLKQSSMPEGLAGAMAPSDFLDLVEFLVSMKGPGKK